MDKLDSTSMNLEEYNIEKLKELFPNCVTEGKIDFDVLREMLGDEVDNNREKYQFTWNGKAQAIKIAQMPSTATLRPCKEKSKDWDSTENLYIEGDNLEVLKQLQKTYFGKIKMIYIDPPYNTGGDFVYKDDFKNSIENYKQQTQQTTKSNPETSGRYHTDWLNMMYPRLILARNLLSEDGAIFISIDDREQENLKKICNEIFGEANCVGVGQWRRVEGKPGKAVTMARTSEFVLIYAKDFSNFVIGTLPLSEDGLKEFRYSDNKGRFRRGQIYYPNRGIHHYSVRSPYGNSIEGDFTIRKEVFDDYVTHGKIYWAEQGEHTPYLKIYLSEFDGVTPTNTFGKEYGSSQSAVKEFKALFGTNDVIFDNPKPTKLIDRLLLIANLKEDSVVLDFFSGSATTAHSLLKAKAEKNSKQKFIMVQLPEQTKEDSEAFKLGYKNICDVGEKRIDLAGEQIKAEWIEKHTGEGLFANDNIEFPIDIGFKVFKLDSTNIKQWDNSSVLEEDDLGLYNKVFKDGRSKEDILYEIMLKYGFFDMKTSEVSINGKQMYKVGSRFMLVCLEDHISSDDINAICEEKPKYVVFKEDGFANDNDKINAEYNLKKAGVEEVKCI